MSILFLFSVFFRIGVFNFGGGLAMLPLIFQSVQDFGLMTAQEFSDLVAISQITPGPIAVNAATFVGYSYAGIPGAFAATFGVCFPSFVIMLVVMKFMDKFKESRVMQGAMDGIRPVTVGLIAAAAFFIGDNILTKGEILSAELLTGLAEYINLIPVGIFVLTMILAGKFKVNPIVICIGMGVVGAVLCG